MCVCVCVVYVPDHNNKLQPELPKISLSSIIRFQTIPVPSFPTQPSQSSNTYIPELMYRKKRAQYSLLCKSTFFLQKQTQITIPKEMEMEGDKKK